MSELTFPKDRLSWTMVDMFENRRSQYERRYLYRMPTFETKYLKSGRWFHDLLESDSLWTLDDHMFLIAKKLTRYECGEDFMEATIRGIPVVIKMDTYRADLSAFRDYKTSTKEWDQWAVDSHGQLLFYGSVIRELTGKVPECGLDWIETQVLSSGELIFTGRVEKFDRILTHELLDEWEEYLVDVAQRIHIDWQMHLGGDSLLLDKPLIQEFVKVCNLGLMADAERKELTDPILNAMDEAGVDRIRSPHGLIYQHRRRSYEYSDYVQDLEEEIAELKEKLEASRTAERIRKKEQELKAQKRAEERAGATYYEQRTVAFKPKN